MKKILVVDDIKTERLYLRRMLERNGFAVVEADGGKQAIEMAVADAPAAILMDIVMPDMNGFQAIRDLRKDARTAGIPVIVVSTKNRAPDEMQARASGASGYLVKPAQEPALLGALAKLSV